MNEKYATHCVKRLSGLPYFPLEKNPRNELLVEDLVKAFWRSADDERHAERATDLLLERCRERYPVPAQIVDACNDTRAAQDDSWAPNLDPCPECNGSGFRIITKGRYTGAERCPCGDGKAKRVLEHA